MQAVIVKHGIIKSDRVDLTVIPCSGKLKTFEEEGDSNRVDIEWYGLPAPNDLETEDFPRGPIGFLSELLTPTVHIGQSSNVVYATTSNGGSSIDALMNIGRCLGRLTQMDPKKRLIEAPFLGTGKGGLAVTAAVQALSQGFKETRHPHAVLRLRSFTASLVTEAEDALRQPSILAQDDVKVLVLNSTPDDQIRIRTDKEAALLEERVKMIDNPHKRISVIQRFAVRLDQIQAELLEHKPQILHFSGHGTKGVLLFENRDGSTARLDGKVLANIIAAYGKLDCIVLNACFTEEVSRACAVHVQTVIGSTSDTDDSAAAKFTYAFYAALAHGRPYDNAFEIGCNEVATVNQNEADKYCIFPPNQ